MINKNIVYILKLTILFLLISFTGCDNNYYQEHDELNKQNNAIQNENKKIINSINLGSKWFLYMENKEFIYYEYDIKKNTSLNTTHVTRELGALWAISKSYKLSNDVRYKNLSEKGFKYFEKYFEYDKKNDFMILNITPKTNKLAYPAFIILALLEMDHPKKDYYLEKFANAIIFQQQESGELKTFFYSNSNLGVDYYPGESLLALMSLYEYSGDKEYLDTVKNAFPFYRTYFRNNANRAFAPWHIRAYTKLYNVTKAEEVSDFIFELSDYIIEYDKTIPECYNFNFTREISTAAYLEGVVQAYNTAKNSNNNKKAKCYMNYLNEGAEDIIKLQIRNNSNPSINGGFLPNNKSNILRVDNNQHAIMALVEIYNTKK